MPETIKSEQLMAIKPPWRAAEAAIGLRNTRAAPVGGGRGKGKIRSRQTDLWSRMSPRFEGWGEVQEKQPNRRRFLPLFVAKAVCRFER